MRVVWTFLLSSFLSSLCLPLFGRRPDNLIKSEILSQWAVKPKTTNQPTNFANYGLWASVLHYGLCAFQNPHTIMQRKKHIQELSCTCTAAKIELSSSLSMDGLRTELEIQESRH